MTGPTEVPHWLQTGAGRLSLATTNPNTTVRPNQPNNQPNRPVINHSPSKQSATQIIQSNNQVTSQSNKQSNLQPANQPNNAANTQSDSWRHLQRLRTGACCLALCLNLGVDPPDSNQSNNPASRLQCWLDTTIGPRATTLKQIGARLKQQYERWHERGKYRVELDPTSDGLKRALVASRRAANASINPSNPNQQGERVLFHYNGHGVPRPTANGEIWVFNSSYTQYIPVSIYDLQAWLSPYQPAIFVVDCHSAGLVWEAFMHFMKQRREREERRERANQSNSSSNSASSPTGSQMPANLDPATHPRHSRQPPTPLNQSNNSSNNQSNSQSNAQSIHPHDCLHIFLGACSADDSLPDLPDMPADLFSACLTTPIKTALIWYANRSIYESITLSMIESLPGIKKPNNRRTPFGELNWIFTAITDAIAWSTLPLSLFHSLFRQDLLVASLCRNFFLAQRIYANINMQPVSWPVLPNTHQHPMWQAWDLAVDVCLSQLEKFAQSNDQADDLNDQSTSQLNEQSAFVSSPFFENQLTAFEVWLEFGSTSQSVNRSINQSVPMQLPIVLQVLLSHQHRRFALLLLCRYMDKGPHCVQAALDVGIFPYVLKLLQHNQSNTQTYNQTNPQANNTTIYPANSQPSSQTDNQTGNQSNNQTAYQSGSGDAQSQNIPSSHSTNPPPNQSTNQQSSQFNNPFDSDLRDVLVFIWMKIIAFDGTTSNDLTKPDYCAYFLSHLLSINQSTNPVNIQATNPSPNHPSNRTGSPIDGTPVHQSSSRSPHDGKAYESPAHQSPGRQHSSSQTIIQSSQSPNGSHTLHPAVNQVITQTLYQSPGLYGGSSPAFFAASHPTPLHHPIHQSINQSIDQSVNLPISDPHFLSQAAQRFLSGSDQQHIFALFILSNIAYTNPRGAQTIVQTSHPSISQTSNQAGNQSMFLSLINPHLQSSNPLLRRWVLLCLAQLWRGFPPARLMAAIDGVHEHVFTLLYDNTAEVRAAALLCLSALFGKNNSLQPTSIASAIAEKDRIEIEIHIGYVMSFLCMDGSSLVRREMILGLAECIYHHTDLFVSLYSHQTKSSAPKKAEPHVKKAWLILRSVLRCARDPHPLVNQAATEVKTWIKRRKTLLANPIGRIHPSINQPISQAVNQAKHDGDTTPSNSQPSPSLAPSVAAPVNHSVESDDGDAVPPPRPAMPLAGLRHFDRYKMSHMRPPPHIQSVNQPSNQSSRVASPRPSTPSTLHDDLGSVDGSVDGDAFLESEPAPLDERVNDPMWTVPKSTLFQTSCAHFTQSLLPMASDEADEVPSLSTLSALSAKQSKLNSTIDRTRRAAHDYKSGSLMSFVEVGFFACDWESTQCVRMSPAGSLLYACDSRSSVGVWNYSAEDSSFGQERVNEFQNENLGARMTAMEIVNPMSSPMLLIGSDDGVVRLWKDAEKPGQQSMVAAFTAIPQPEVISLNALSVNQVNPSSNQSIYSTLQHPLTQTFTFAPTATSSLASPSTVTATVSQRRRSPRSPLILDWHQTTGRLGVSGHATPLIKVWDVDAEMLMANLVVHQTSDVASAQSSITCLSSDGFMYYAGTSDGWIHAIDLRAPSSEGSSVRIDCHDGAVVSLTWSYDAVQRPSLVSASHDGEVRIHDLRVVEQSLAKSTRSPSYRMTRPSHTGSASPLTVFTAHPILPLFASASSTRPFVEIFDRTNHLIDSIKYHIGFLGQRIGPVNALDFHPHRSLIAIGCQDPYISIFAAEKL